MSSLVQRNIMFNYNNPTHFDSKQETTNNSHLTLSSAQQQIQPQPQHFQPTTSSNQQDLGYAPATISAHQFEYNNANPPNTSLSAMNSNHYSSQLPYQSMISTSGANSIQHTYQQFTYQQQPQSQSLIPPSQTQQQHRSFRFIQFTSNSNSTSNNNSNSSFNFI